MSEFSTSFAAAASALDNRPTPSPRKTGDTEAARKAAEEFEAFFLSQVLDSMFKGLKTDGPFGGGHGESVYRSLLLQEYGKAVAKNSNYGIADAVMRELLTSQEVK